MSESKQVEIRDIVTPSTKDELEKVTGGQDGGDNIWYKMYRYLEGGSTGKNGYGR